MDYFYESFIKISAIYAFDCIFAYLSPKIAKIDLDSKTGEGYTRPSFKKTLI